MMRKGLRVGPAGWSYKDWNGIVYPQNATSKFDPLEYLARFFDTIEINSSFYRPPTESTTRAWCKRVAANPDFVFTAKMPRVFTHERGKASAEDEKAFREGMDTMAGSGRLGAVLLQFPWSFKNTEEERPYLMSLIDRFNHYPLVVEVRHVSWNTPGIYEALENKGVGVCNIDQPIFSKSIRPSSVSTSPIGYVRLHGRNYQNWFRAQAPRDDRYDYLYSAEELEPWIVRIKEVAAQTKESYVITNNHFRGKAVVNAVELKSVLEGKPVAAPASLTETYPELTEYVAPEQESSQSNSGDLFA